MNAVIISPAPTIEVHPRTARAQYWDGFDLYVRCHFTGEWPNADEIAAQTSAELKGYNAAADAQAEAEYAEYRGNVNAYGDLTEY